MRIIAGTHRGRRILSPEGAEVTRPITDRVKQSLFDRLAAAERIEGAVVLDVFAGTGSLGLECLSRGAAHVTFVEQDRSAATLLEQNLAMLREQAKSRILRINALSPAMTGALPRRDYTLVFYDPPYAMVEDKPQARRLWDQLEQVAAICTDGAWMMVRAEKHARLPPLLGWSEPKSVTYGSMTLHLYQRLAHGSAPAPVQR